jgi:hypothetical protein
MKKTALDYFVEKLNYFQLDYPLFAYNEAKEMEKEQITDAYDEAKVEGMCLATNSEYKHLQGFEYYNETFKEKKIKDTIVESVLSAFRERSERGIDKYGVTLNRTDLSTLEWLKHLQEELMDATLYIERLKQEFNNLK